MELKITYKAINVLLMKTYVVSVKKSTREVSGRWLMLQEGTEEGDRVQGIVQVTFDQNVGQHSPTHSQTVNTVGENTKSTSPTSIKVFDATMLCSDKYKYRQIQQLCILKYKYKRQ